MKCKTCPDLMCRHRTSNAEQDCVYDEHFEKIMQRANQTMIFQSLDWDAFRREAAKDMACAIVHSDISGGDGKEFAENVAKAAIMFADELIRQLKEEKK